MPREGAHARGTHVRLDPARRHRGSVVRISGPGCTVRTRADLHVPSHPGHSRPAPLVETDVEVEVNGIVARGLTRQTFVNPDSFWVEGIYVFPLPDDAAIDRLLIRVGDRVIRARSRSAPRPRAPTPKRAGRARQPSGPGPAQPVPPVGRQYSAGRGNRGRDRLAAAAEARRRLVRAVAADRRGAALYPRRPGAGRHAPADDARAVPDAGPDRAALSPGKRRQGPAGQLFGFDRCRRHGWKAWKAPATRSP